MNYRGFLIQNCYLCTIEANQFNGIYNPVPISRASIPVVGSGNVSTASMTGSSIEGTGIYSHRLQMQNNSCDTLRAPAPIACGANPSVVGNDQVGHLLVGDGAITSCTLKFAQSHAPAIPNCSFSATANAYLYISEVTPIRHHNSIFRELGRQSDLPQLQHLTGEVSISTLQSYRTVCLLICLDMPSLGIEATHQRRRALAKRFVLVDRDGTLNLEKNYLSDPDQLELISGAGAALKRLQEAGWGICVVSNQSGVARGYFDMEQLAKVHRRLEEMLTGFDVQQDGIYLCPHSPDDRCNCRKPLPGMVRQAMADHGFDPRQAWVVGDKEVDVGLGHAL
jgi:D-glycero-D-manno-heptose 1,7-bisphosphate phosphatase